MKKNNIKKMLYCNSENWENMKKKLMRNEFTITDFFNKFLEKISYDDNFLEKVIKELNKK